MLQWYGTVCAAHGARVKRQQPAGQFLNSLRGHGRQRGAFDGFDVSGSQGLKRIHDSDQYARCGRGRR